MTILYVTCYIYLHYDINCTFSSVDLIFEFSNMNCGRVTLYANLMFILKNVMYLEYFFGKKKVYLK